MHVGEGLS
jgi:hypothetical protein